MKTTTIFYKFINDQTIAKRTSILEWLFEYLQTCEIICWYDKYFSLGYFNVFVISCKYRGTCPEMLSMFWCNFWTRMHSSRKRTARLFSQHALLLGGVLVRGVYLPSGVYLSKGGCTSWGVPAWGVYLPRCSQLWTEFLTHATENITLPQTSFVGGNKDALQ